jgi:hypothetical protein
MAMEIHVLFAGELPGKAALQKAMRNLGFPFSIKPTTGSLGRQKGFMPMTLRREETGVEFDVFEGRAAVEDVAGRDVDPRFERVANFRWGGDETEAAAGLCGAAALAKITNGIVLEEQEDRLLSVDEAVGLARSYLDRLRKSQDRRRPGTRPADIKRYLKPLLDQRSDLVLRDRLLLIRPVRHLMRGVLLDRTSGKYGFQVYPYLNPLYGSARSVGFCDPIHGAAWKVYEPYFEDLLFDALEEDIFAPLGRIASLDDFAGDLSTRGARDESSLRDARVLALVLAGRRDHAAAVIDEIEQSRQDHHYWPHWARTQRAFLAKDLAEVCAEYHEREAATAEALKLGDAWEPSPFPVELPEVEQVAKCSEPLFVTTPWVPRPPGLWQEAPHQPGDVRYAVLTLTRNGRQILWMPLTQEQAATRHANREDYVLSTRMPDGVLVVLRHTTFWSPRDPEKPKNPRYIPGRNLYLDLYGSMGRMTAHFSEDVDEQGMLKLINVFLVPSTTAIRTWHAFNDFPQMEKSIRESKGGPTRHTRRPMSDLDMSLLCFSTCDFGEFDHLFRRLSSYLRNEGFGRFQ